MMMGKMGEKISYSVGLLIEPDEDGMEDGVLRERRLTYVAVADCRQDDNGGRQGPRW